MIAEDDDPLGRQPGERLWSEWFTEEQVIEARSNAQKWVALYQQRPSAETGDYFKAEWLKPYTAAPDRKTMRVYGASDYAVTSNGGDYTVHVVVGLDPDGKMYLLDLWREQAASDKWVEAFCDLVSKWKPIGWAEETGQIRSGVGPYLDRRQRERRAYVAREHFPTRGDKAVRAQSIRGRMALEGLHVPVYAPWFPDFRAELLSFPFGKHDDAVDALGLVGQLLDKMLAGARLQVVTTRKWIVGTRCSPQTTTTEQIGRLCRRPTMGNPTGKGGFQKGQSGNAGGRPKLVGEVQELAEGYTEEAIEALVARDA